MGIEQSVRDITVEESRGSALLWLGVLGSPLAWGGHLVLNYALEEWFACSPAATDEGEILGFPVDQVSVTLNSAMALIAAVSGLAALRCWRMLRRGTGDGPAGTDSADRARWMAFAGTVEGAIFLAAILLGYAPPLMLDTCASTP